MKDNNIYSKFILDLTDIELEKELSDLLGKTIKKPPKWNGDITNSPSHYFNNSKIDEEKLIELYNKKSMETYFVTLAFTSLRNRPKDIFSLIRSQKKNNKVLEYGYGTSTHGIACAQKGCEVWGVDVSEYMKKMSLARYSKRDLSANLIGVKDSIPENYFDTILCTDVFEHVPDPIFLLRNMMRWLKKDGTIHLRVSTMINYKKGHLAQAINAWKKTGLKIIKKRFTKISKNNYRYNG